MTTMMMKATTTRAAMAAAATVVMAMAAGGCVPNDDGLAAVPGGGPGVTPDDGAGEGGVERPGVVPGSDHGGGLRPPVRLPGPTTPGQEPGEEPPVDRSCDGATPSPRCAADPDAFEAYGAASLLSRVEVAGDESCCGDFDDDGEPDNALGAGFAAAQRLEQLNLDLQASLHDGSQPIVFEFEGLDGIDDDAQVDLHVWRARWDVFDFILEGGLHPVLLDPSSIDRGVSPLLSFRDARVVGGQLRAAEGYLSLTTTFYEFPLTVELLDVELSATLSGGAAPGRGVAMREGRIGGRIEVASLHGQLNTFAAGCECLGLEGPLVDPDPFEKIGVCARPQTAACAEAGRDECVELVEACPFIDAFAPNIADLDADGDGVAESISFGAFFAAERAKIEGVDL